MAIEKFLSSIVVDGTISKVGGTSSQFLKADGSVDSTTYTTNLDTVTSVGMTVPTGLSISGSPITTSGILALTLTAGYSIPTTANQTNWSTAFTQTLQWNGGATNLVATTGRTSLGGTTIGQSMFTLVNPSAITFPQFNANNTISALTAAAFRTAIGAGTSSTVGTVTSVTAGNGMTQSGTSTINPTLNIVSHAGSAGTIGTINIGADAIGVNLGTTSTTAAAGNDARLSDARTPLAHNQAWSTITSTPTTLSGYGITDAAPISGSANYIQNQNASAQSANMWINGIVKTVNPNVGWAGWIENSAVGGSGLVITSGDTSGTSLLVRKKDGTETFSVQGTGAATFSSTVTASNGTLIGGTLTSGYIPKATGVNSLGNSLIYDNGTNVGIGTSTPLGKFDIRGGTSQFTHTTNDWTSGSLGSYLFVAAGANSGNTFYQIGAQTGGGSAWGNLVLQSGGGNVLIGTTTDNGNKLRVAAGNISIDAGYKLQYSSTAYMTPENNVNGAEIATGGIFTLKTGGTTERLRVDASGNVGIGTTSPNDKLEIAGALNIQGTNSGATIPALGTNGGRFKLLNANVYGVIADVLTNGDTYFQSKRIDGNTSAYNLLFNPLGGNVLIGTTTDTNGLLQVNGITRIISPAAPTTNDITSKFLTYSTSPYGIIFRGYSSGIHSIQVQREASDAERFPLSLQPLGGNVLIGTTTDNGSKLRVEGDTYISGKVSLGQSTYRKPATTQCAGEIVYYGTGTTVAGKLYYLSTGLVWTLADSDAVASSSGMLGIAIGTDPATNGMLVRGSARFDALTPYTAMTAGQILYVSTTAGDFTATAPTGTGKVVRVIGYCVDDTNNTLYFCPDNTWIELT